MADRWAVGEIVTATNMNRRMFDARCQVRMSAPQSITNGTSTALLFGVEDFDLLGWHSTVTNTNRITPTINGWYKISYSTHWQTDTDYVRTLVFFQKNGAATLPPFESDVLALAATPADLGATPAVPMNGTTDYLEFLVFQQNTSAGANTVDASWLVELVLPVT